MDFEQLTSEQQKKAKACKTPEELLALANTEGYELSDEELEAITGGEAWYRKCSKDDDHGEVVA